MENKTCVTLMIMYEDQSVDVRSSNGAQIQLSPCGCEFMLLKPAEPCDHPVKPPERVRQRTRFTISAHKDSKSQCNFQELIVAALAFRNKYARRPYLPEELIPVDNKTPFFSINSDIQWPQWSSIDKDPAPRGPKGETIVRSEEGRAVLMLSPSGEEFYVEYTCNLSQNKNQHPSTEVIKGSQQQYESNLICQSSYDETKDINEGGGNRRNDSVRSSSCSPQISSTALPKPEEMFQSTTVVQHHSCSDVDPIWFYPLYLARHLWTAHFSKPEDVEAEGVVNLHQMFDPPSVESRSQLPPVLPLTCTSPHWHRWKLKDPLVIKKHLDQDLPTELVKVMWCQGVTYRILSGVVSVIEVSPGDGSVLRSNGVLNSYFTHHKPEPLSGRVKEVTYHLNSLPPDVPGQPYSICSVVSRASRILTCYNEAKQSLKLPVTLSCLEDGRCVSKPTMIEGDLSNPPGSIEQRVNVARSIESRSDLVAAELEKIKRFNFLLENNCMLRREKGCTEVGSNSAEEVKHESISENCIAEALQRTSKAIQDIDALISAATLT